MSFQFYIFGSFLIYSIIFSLLSMRKYATTRSMFIQCLGVSQVFNGDQSMFNAEHIENIKPGKRHKVLIEWPIQNRNFIPFKGRGAFHEYIPDYVRLPTSKSNIFEEKPIGGGIKKVKFWANINKSLKQEFSSTAELEKAISSYARINTLVSLHECVSKFNQEEKENFFKKILPAIIDLALRLPDLIQSGIPLLKPNNGKDSILSITLSQYQAACLLANAFLCTFPANPIGYPSINFNRLFEAEGQHVVEKIKCVINYFKRVSESKPKGLLTFYRQSIIPRKMPDWRNEKKLLSGVVLDVRDKGTIEADGKGLLQVDFANKYIGGGVLGRGCVQEEIRFIINPELIVSRLFTECLKENEALIMVGTEQYNSYSGYSSTFKFDGNFYDQTPNDSDQRRKCSIVAIDALYFSDPSKQYLKYNIRRELNKAYVGFYRRPSQPPGVGCDVPGVATGNWGCGAFGGNPKLKFLLQLMVCAKLQKPLLYFTFGDKQLKEDIVSMYQFLSNKNISVSQLWHCLLKFESRHHREDLYAFIRRYFDGSNSFGNLEVTDKRKELFLNKSEKIDSLAQSKQNLEALIIESDHNSLDNSSETSLPNQEIKTNLNKNKRKLDFSILDDLPSSSESLRISQTSLVQNIKRVEPSTSSLNKSQDIFEINLETTVINQNESPDIFESSQFSELTICPSYTKSIEKNPKVYNIEISSSSSDQNEDFTKLEHKPLCKQEDKKQSTLLDYDFFKTKRPFCSTKENESNKKPRLI